MAPLGGGPARPLPEGRAVVAGRSATSGFPLDDDTASRQHAELRADASGVTVRDLGSVNGTRINGTAITAGRAAANDVISFGAQAFRVIPAAAAGLVAAEASATEPDLPAGTAVRAVDVSSGGGPLRRLAAERLARLVELARQLSGEIDPARVLATVADLAAALLPADRVAVLLIDEETGVLRTAESRNRLGEEAVDVPRSIARRALEERAPVITDNAQADVRFQSGSVAARRVRAALGVPLLAEQGRALGVLYVDTLAGGAPFSDDDAALCLAFGGLAAVAIATARLAQAVRRQELTRANFERFFAPDVAARIAARTSGARPGGERRPVTVLFADIRGFIRLAEGLAPETVAELLSEYLALMVEVVFAHGGTLDKFIGDALLAVWGAPAGGVDDADRALAAAREMQAECRVLAARWTAAGRPPVAIGIGLHHGEAFTGTIGSPRRLDYTVIGDVVNVAARLCDAARPGEIVVSAAVQGLLARTLAGATAEKLEVRGRDEPVVIYRTGEKA